MADRSATLLPGLTLCAQCRSRDAICTESPGERGERHLCAECADDAIEAACSSPALRELANTARGEWRRPLPLPQLPWEKLDFSKVEALRAQWLSFQAGVSELARCWAVLHDGTRCVREASTEGVCDTHYVLGCRVPGLGWRGGEPRGRVIARRGRSAA